MAAVDTSPLVYTNRGPGIVISCSILGFISTVFVILRFWARRLTRQSFGLDDWLCVASLLCHHAILAAAGIMVYRGGLGRDIRISATEDPTSTVYLFQVKTLLTFDVKRELTTRGFIGTPSWRGLIYLQFPTHQTVCAGPLLANIPYIVCQDGLQSPWWCKHHVVYCHYNLGLCTMSTSAGILVPGTPAPPNNSLPRSYDLLPCKFNSQYRHRLLHPRAASS